MRHVIVVDAQPRMILHEPVLGPDGEAILAAGHVLTQEDLAMLRESAQADIAVEDALAPYIPVRALFPAHIEAAALQALNGLIMVHPGLDQPVRFKNVQKLLGALDELVDGVLGDLDGTADFAGPDSLQGRDYIHPIKVAELCTAMGRLMGMPKAELLSLAQASALMNIGYSALRRSLLDEPRGLEEHEWRHQVEMHPQYSVRILTESGLSDGALVAIEQHHERWDGSGYPRGLKGKGITQYARIIAIGDTYVSLRSRRAYRPPLTHKEALDLLSDGSDEFFDPELVRVFNDLAARLITPVRDAHPEAARATGAAAQQEEEAALRSRTAEEGDDTARATARGDEPETPHDDETARRAPARAAAVSSPPPSASRAAPKRVGGTPGITTIRRPEPRPVSSAQPAEVRRACRRRPGSLWAAAFYLESTTHEGWSSVDRPRL
ncbi:MAG: HD-GYP domain-containing protein [Dehalococcoidia bacterium]